MVLWIARVTWGEGTLLKGELAGVLQDQGCIEELLGSIASKEDANTLYEGQEDAPHHCRAHHGHWATAGSQHSPGQCSTGDGVLGIFFALQVHQDGREQVPPHTSQSYLQSRGLGSSQR